MHPIQKVHFDKQVRFQKAHVEIKVTEPRSRLQEHRSVSVCSARAVNFERVDLLMFGMLVCWCIFVASRSRS